MDYGEHVTPECDDDDIVNTVRSLDEIQKDTFYHDLNLSDEDAEGGSFAANILKETQVSKGKGVDYHTITHVKRDSCVCCWWCCHTFKSASFTIPTQHDEIRKRWKYFGVFCSASCAKAYAVREFKGGDMGHKSSIFTKFMKDIYNVHPPILPAPPRQSLKMFNGSLTIAQFRKASRTSLSEVVLPPHDPYASLIMTRQLNAGQNKKPQRERTRPVSSSYSIDDNTELKLSRKTPKRVKGTIFETMNITTIHKKK